MTEHNLSENLIEGRVVPTHRTANFSAGPAALPTAVLQRAQAELLDYNGLGVSVMEISHRSPAFMEIAEHARNTLRNLLCVPNTHEILFLQGGATLQFTGVPLNLLGGADAENDADYLVTGAWSQKALVQAAAMELGNCRCVATGEPNYSTLPSGWCSQNAAYFHYCSNETVHGLQLEIRDIAPFVADKVPIVCDMSSDILSKPLDVSRFGLIYAGAQKNIGPAGLTLVIVDKSLLGRAHNYCPPVLNYTVQAQNDSMANTPPTFAWYLAGLVFEWVAEQGGVAAMAQKNTQKAALIYDAIDSSGGFYRNDVAQKYRSAMNVPFFLPNEALTNRFIAGATENGLLHLKGHKLVGGIRASLYNAVPLPAVQQLAEFMNEFARKNG